eukprot:15631_4
MMVPLATCSHELDSRGDVPPQALMSLPWPAPSKGQAVTRQCNRIISENPAKSKLHMPTSPRYSRFVLLSRVLDTPLLLSSVLRQAKASVIGVRSHTFFPQMIDSDSDCGQPFASEDSPPDRRFAACCLLLVPHSPS